MADYIPGPDASFQTWQSNFVTYANASLAALGLTAADMTPITSAQSGWATAFHANQLPHDSFLPPTHMNVMWRGCTNEP
jgi:threonine/homoserine/homoserine lactone efflux protein